MHSIAALKWAVVENLLSSAPVATLLPVCCGCHMSVERTRVSRRYSCHDGATYLKELPQQTILLRRLLLLLLPLVLYATTMAESNDQQQSKAVGWWHMHTVPLIFTCCCAEVEAVTNVFRAAFKALVASHMMWKSISRVLRQFAKL